MSYEDLQLDWECKICGAEWTADHFECSVCLLKEARVALKYTQEARDSYMDAYLNIRNFAIENGLDAPCLTVIPRQSPRIKQRTTNHDEIKGGQW